MLLEFGPLEINVVLLKRHLFFLNIWSSDVFVPMGAVQACAVFQLEVRNSAFGSSGTPINYAKCIWITMLSIIGMVTDLTFHPGEVSSNVVCLLPFVWISIPRMVNVLLREYECLKKENRTTSFGSNREKGSKKFHEAGDFILYMCVITFYCLKLSLGQKRQTITMCFPLIYVLTFLTFLESNSVELKVYRILSKPSFWM